LKIIKENKLNNKHKIEIDGYNIIRNDIKNTTQGGGGTAIIKINYKFKNIDILTNKKLTCIETSTILLKLKNNKKFIYYINVCIT